MSTISKIQKRNGAIVDFDPAKITKAVSKAFQATLSDPHLKDAEEISKHVTGEIERRFEGSVNVPGVEFIQDMVERAIAERGYFSVAKAYILYRYEHAKAREEEKQELVKKIEGKELSITKRDGSRETFSVEKIRKALSYLGSDLAGINIDVIVEQVKVEVYEGITTKDISRTLIMVVRSMIERDPVYSILAARLLRVELAKEAFGGGVDFGTFEKQYRERFITNVKRAVELKKLDPRMLDFDLEAVANLLVPERDDLLRYLGLQTLADRYFIKNSVDTEDASGPTLEMPQYFWMRVAMGLSLGETEKMKHVTDFYEVMSTLHYVPSTPTLFHSGTPHPQLASCYLNTVEDDLNHIFKVYGDNAQLSKWAGGIGTDWTNLRATGALIKSAGIHSQGVIPFLKIANDVTVAINRSGRRRGATCVYLEVWHYDFEDFLELRKNTGDERRRTHDMNIASWVPDLFMKRVRDDGAWIFFSPDETPDLHHLYGKRFDEAYVKYEKMAERGEIHLFRKVQARDLWKKMLTMLFETGHPWITWKDPSNIRSPQDHVGVVHNSNLCTEITLNNSADETAVCNLGSINFARNIKDGAFDGEKIARTVTVGMRMLDNVIDLNFYPTQETRNSNMRHRPVGLGIMGFQDALYQLGISFDSEQCIDFADRSMEIVSYYALLASSLLAKERGSYESFKGSKWDRGIFPLDTLKLLEDERGEAIAVPRTMRLNWDIVRESIRGNGMRNSNTMAIAPTATISNISGCTPAIEPIYKNIYVKSNISGDFTVVNPHLIEDLKKIHLWDDDMLGKLKYHDGSIAAIPEIPEEIRARYKETFEIDPSWLIKAAAWRGKWIDQSQSLNIFFRSQSGKQLSETYFFAWSLGLKTTYYLRTMAASQVEKSTVSTSEFGSTHVRKNEPSPVSAMGTNVGTSGASTPLAVSAHAGGDGTASLAALTVSPSPIQQADMPEKAVKAAPQYTITKIGDAVCESCE